MKMCIYNYVIHLKYKIYLQNDFIYLLWINRRSATVEEYAWILFFYNKDEQAWGTINQDQQFHVLVKKNISVNRAPDKLRICVFYAMKTSKNACIIRSECTFTHTYCCVSKLSKFGAYLCAVDDNTSCT
jgi:hypothetical protein